MDVKNYGYKNALIGKKELRQLLAWSFSNYNSTQASSLADELKYLGFDYASQAGISISIEDLKIPFVKSVMLKSANQEIIDAEKLFSRGKITDVERYQKLIENWSSTSESLKNQVVFYFKNYDPLNSVYIMAFSGARGNLSQVRQLVGMRGLMSDPSGEIMNLPIEKNFREGLTITDYLMSGYGARKGIVDTALKTANSGYLTRRLIDVSQDIFIREKNCSPKDSFLFRFSSKFLIYKKKKKNFDRFLGRVLNDSIIDPNRNHLIARKNTQITTVLIKKLQEKKITKFSIRSPLTCTLYRAICQKCYGWDLSSENLIDIGESVGILAGQSIGEPGTQLTMRTFHTGGIFNSGIRQRIVSTLSGIVQYSKILKTVTLRTNRGENVLLSRNSGFLILVGDKKPNEFVKIEITRNTILFPKNNQYISKNTLIGELINRNREIRTEIKPILADTGGEIFIPRLMKKDHKRNNNKLIWILFGQVSIGPLNCFLNFFPDYKLNDNSYIFRTKLINYHSGFVDFLKKKNQTFQKKVELTINKNWFFQSKVQNFDFSSSKFENSILKLKNLKYLVRLKQNYSKNYLQITRNYKIATEITNKYKTLTGGTVYYDFKSLTKPNFLKKSISYYSKWNNRKKTKSFTIYQTLVWFNEEIHKVNCEADILFVEHGDFISKQFELIPGLFSKTSGLVIIDQKNNLVKTITIKSGTIFEGKKFKAISKKLYYPGEILFKNVFIKNLSFCEHLIRKNSEQLLVRPIQIYESSKITEQTQFLLKTDNNLNLNLKSYYLYKSNQTVKGSKNLNVIENLLTLEKNKSVINNFGIKVSFNKKKQHLQLKLVERVDLNTYLPSYLKYKKIQSSLLFQINQFLNRYTILGYLESINKNSLEIVKLKIKKQKFKEVLLIPNNYCTKIPKNKNLKKKLNDVIIDNSNATKMGKIIIENAKFFVVQKGQPYFFPNCKKENEFLNTSTSYKTIFSNRINNFFKTTRNVALNYSNVLKFCVTKKSFSTNQTTTIEAHFSKLFFKNNEKIYSSLVPQLIKKFSVNDNRSKFNTLFRKEKIIKTKKNKILALQSLELASNLFKKTFNPFFLVKLVEYPFPKITKTVGFYSITEDFFEHEVNSVFCRNNEFIDLGKVLGLLNLEKEITEDIVQGLPRIEEILEARKKNLTKKNLPTREKKGLLVQKTNLDINFEFKKLGTFLQETDQINPHRLLKVYFNYYGLAKSFLNISTKSTGYYRLTNNYEGSYKSLKKVQSFILNSVQKVYESQGVGIHNKHLEIIIKQMTTKVLITYEGETPLLKREIIDLYHIYYINKITQTQKKQIAYYVPLLLGITKAALNNPSFISAASFQETTRILTKSAIEGRIDWLRGLKENIIVGHLIPSGTGSLNYKHSFKKKRPKIV